MGLKVPSPSSQGWLPWHPAPNLRNLQKSPPEGQNKESFVLGRTSCLLFRHTEAQVMQGCLGYLKSVPIHLCLKRAPRPDRPCHKLSSLPSRLLREKSLIFLKSHLLSPKCPVTSGRRESPTQITLSSSLSLQTPMCVHGLQHTC